MPGCSPYTRLGNARDIPDEETTDWRAVCGKTERAVRRAGRRKPSRPLSGSRAGSPGLLLSFRELAMTLLWAFACSPLGGHVHQEKAAGRRRFSGRHETAASNPGPQVDGSGLPRSLRSFAVTAIADLPVHIVAREHLRVLFIRSPSPRVRAWDDERLQRRFIAVFLTGSSPCSVSPRSVPQGPTTSSSPDATWPLPGSRPLNFI